MDKDQPVKRRIHFRLIHNGAQPGTPLDEPFLFGLQDTKGEVHPGLTQPGEPRDFDFVLEVSDDNEADGPIFRGSLAHGPRNGRFIYLSWKRQNNHGQPWGWRIKIPLSGVKWDDVRAAEQPGMCLAANVIARRPHTSEAITWRAESMTQKGS